MDQLLMPILASVAVGATAGAAGHFARSYFSLALDVIERDLADKLHRLRVPTTRLRRLLTAWIIAVAFVFLGLFVGLGSPILAITISLILCCGPWYLVRRIAEWHRLKIEDQLADAMVMLANGVRAGLSLPQSLEMLATDCPRPIKGEFTRIVAEYNLGKPLTQTLAEARRHLRSENFALLVAALLASHESGGRLNVTVERIARSVQELHRLERKVQSETAQARKSALYMALAPVVILVVYYFVDPKSTSLLLTENIGQGILAAALVLNLVAYLWARVILNPDI